MNNLKFTIAVFITLASFVLGAMRGIILFSFDCIQQYSNFLIELSLEAVCFKNTSQKLSVVYSCSVWCQGPFSREGVATRKEISRIQHASASPSFAKFRSINSNPALCKSVPFFRMGPLSCSYVDSTQYYVFVLFEIIIVHILLEILIKLIGGILFWLMF